MATPTGFTQLKGSLPAVPAPAVCSKLSLYIGITGQ